MGDEFDDWTKEATPHEASIDVCFDRALVAEYEAAVARLLDARSQKMLEVPADIEAEVVRLGSAVKEKTRTFTFQSIGRRAWRKLLAEHPPTREEDKMAGYDPETFAPAAISASCIRPTLTLKQAEWICEELPLGTFDRFIDACFQANLVGGNEKKAHATAAVLASGRK